MPRIAYAGVDPHRIAKPDDLDEDKLRAERLEVLERECQRQAATIKALEQTMVVVSKLVSGYAAKANGR
jgi:hypothetical protein